jgi:hypothetical protein
MNPRTKENARVGGPSPATGQTENLQEKYSESVESSQRNSTIDPTRLRHLARRLQALRARSVHEYLREVSRQRRANAARRRRQSQPVPEQQELKLF